MKKLIVFTFELLASSLVMLAVVPFFNQNNFLNRAMAQGYDAGYGDSSSYSKYPTDDNKYECRTGPLEGFFVSSVEFCKHVKFDDKDRKDNNRDNRTGTQGPAGPAGPQGIQGPPGEDGINGVNGTNGLPGPSGITQLINGTNVYFVTNFTINNAGEIALDVEAQCQPGDFVINGGYEVGGSHNALTETIFNTPITDPAGGGWRVVQVMGTAGVGAVVLTVNAYCFDNTP